MKNTLLQVISYIKLLITPYFFIGCTLGGLYIFQVNEIQWKLCKAIYDHNDEITSLYFSHTLNILASSSKDGYINLYTYPNFKLFRVLTIADNDYPLSVFLGAFPLPSFVVYSNQKKFYSYSINGKFLGEEVEMGDILSPCVFTDTSFNDYLVRIVLYTQAYGTILGELKIRRFPYMELYTKLTVNNSSTSSPSSLQYPVKCLDITDDKKYIYLWR